MKIVLLHYAAPPVVGGVESVLGWHARLMADAGHAVQVVAGRGAQTDPRVPFVPLPLADSRAPEILAAKTDLDAGRVPAGFDRLAASLAEALGPLLTGVDVLIAHNVCSLNKNLALTAALHNLCSSGGRKPRLILWHHDLAWTTPRYRAELHDGLPWDLLRTDWPGAVQVCVSEARRDELVGLLGVPPERIAVIPNGIDPAAFLKLEARTKDLVARLGLLEAAPLLLLPVRITPRKNLELALQVLAALREIHPRAALVVSGPPGAHDPANAGYLERLLALRTGLGLDGAAHFLAELSGEPLPDAVVADLYRLADALLLPSREEGFGLPLLEAGLAGVPVFCSDLLSLRSLGGGNVRYFSPSAEPKEVAALIATGLASRLDFGLRVRVRTEYTWERIYATHIAPLLASG